MKHRISKSAAAILCALTLTAAPMQATRGEGLIQEITVSAAANTLTFNTAGLSGAFVTSQGYCCSIVSATGKLANFHGINKPEARSLSVPDTVVNPFDGQTYTIVGIGDYKDAPTQNLHLRSQLTSVTLPRKLWCVNAHAFECCNNLRHVYTKSNSVWQKVGESAFKQCTSLETVNFSNATNLTYIFKEAFVGCNNLESISFGSGINTIQFGDDALVNPANGSVFGSLKTNTTTLYFHNSHSSQRDVLLFTGDADLWRNGKLRIRAAKCDVYENWDYLRAQNLTSTLKTLYPNG